MTNEIVFDKGLSRYELLSNFNGVGSNEAVDIRGNIYEYDHMSNRWIQREAKNDQS